MYRLFYDYHTIGDILMIVFNNQKQANRTERRNRTVAIYAGDEIIGANLLNISEIVRIKARGMIINPALEFIDVVNHILINDGLDPLPLQEGSGFVAGQIIEYIKSEDGAVTLAKIDIGSRVIYTRSPNDSSPLFSLVVIALPDTILFNGKTAAVEEIKGVYCEGHLCTYQDLNLANDKQRDDVYLIADFIEIGQDFYAKE
ncbi:MAG: hypothetical protein WC344_00305 [Bacilli bacterium]|jgi:hypothetical protein